MTVLPFPSQALHLADLEHTEVEKLLGRVDTRFPILFLCSSSSSVSPSLPYELARDERLTAS